MKTYTIISHPCSGTHWVEGILRDYPQDKTVPKTSVYQDRYTFKIMCSQRWVSPTFPEVFFHHDVINIDEDSRRWDDLSSGFNISDLPKQQCIFMARDPRDIVVSYYHQIKHRHPWMRRIGTHPTAPDIPDTIDEFVFNDVYGIKRIVAFFNIWADHVKYVIAYEDMHENAEKEIRKLFGFIKVRWIKKADLEMAMRTNTFRSLALSEFKSNRKHDDQGEPEARKMRRGVVGGHRDTLQRDTVKKLDEYIEANLHKKFRRYVN